jgi:uncharacterized protein YkwD
LLTEFITLVNSDSNTQEEWKKFSQGVFTALNRIRQKPKLVIDKLEKDMNAVKAGRMKT